MNDIFSNRNIQKASWLEIDRWTVELADIIKQSEFRPTLLIALARGGWIPTRLLSNFLLVNRITSIGLTYKDSQRKELVAYSFPEPIAEGEKILLIEDRLETGKSLIKAVEMLKSRNADVRTACFFIRTDSLIKPDYYLKKIDDEIIFPWE